MEKCNGDVFQQEHGHRSASIAIAKSLYLKYGPEIKWLCVYTDSEIIYEQISDYYEELLETLYHRNPNKEIDWKYYRNLLSYMSKNNPPLFNKYLDWISANQIKFEEKS